MYFSKFPYIDYTIKNGSSFKTAFVRNIMRRVKLSDEIKGGPGVFIEYDIKDGERPEHIAEKVYGEADYHWLVMLTNDIIDPYFGWYKSSSVLQEYIYGKYSGYSVYFTSATAGSTHGFFYSTKLMSGSSLSQGSNRHSVKEYYPTMCKVTTEFSFQNGGATFTFSDGTQSPVYIHKVEQSAVSAHHFQITRPSGSNGAVETVTVDPLSQQTSSYDYVGGYLSNKENEYPILDTDGVGYTGSGTVSLWETYVGKYMGISGSPVTIYAQANQLYEMEQNEQKRTIKILHPRFKSLAVKELESLLGI
jgi:hypothetical protein